MSPGNSRHEAYNGGWLPLSNTIVNDAAGRRFQGKARQHDVIDCSDLTDTAAGHRKDPALPPRQNWKEVNECRSRP